jgi:hypothetical protein
MQISLREIFYVILIFIITIRPASAIKSPNISNIPDVDLKIATKPNSIDFAGGVIYLFNIYCGFGVCKIEIMSLNECLPDSDGIKSFVPSIKVYSTQSQWLKVISATNSSLEMEIYQFTHKIYPAHIKLKFIPNLPFSTELVSFEATGFFNQNLHPLSNPNVSYIPITGPPHFEKIDCPIKVPGFYGNP